MGHGLLLSPCPLRASTWTSKEREVYANDLDDPRALIAVSAASKRSEADKDPRQWLPRTPATGIHSQCTGLKDSAEEGVIRAGLGRWSFTVGVVVVGRAER
ncbi:hypothetical protein ACWERA_54510, partial [Streptomyces mirabilis]